jgi:very-short-patch-repair endonuclease
LKIFLALLRQNNLPIPVPEYKFHPTRRWRFDYCYPDLRIAIEIEGGVYTKGAHGSITGILRDVEKYTEAAILGYRILRILPADLIKQDTILKIKRALDYKTTNNVV